MNIKDLIIRNRSYRRFDEKTRISKEDLRSFIDLARLSASARNAQPLKYILSWTPEKNALVFQTLSWAAYLKGWEGPAEGERPAAYIIMLGDTAIASHYFCDHGIAAQSILLGATEKGFGGCIIGSVNKSLLQTLLHIPAQYEILHVIALGSPAERVVIEPMQPGGDFKYWRDKEQVHHVPKRSLDELILDL